MGEGSASPDYRELFDDIEFREDRASETVYSDTLVPWLEANGEAAKSWLQGIAQRPGNPIPAMADEDLFCLYALSRVNDLLLVNFQPDRGCGGGPQISLAEYVSFMTALGLRSVEEAAFSPFFHEIVTVEQDANTGSPIVIRGEYWPSFMLGEMMFSRAGVAVSGGLDHICKEIAENSTMYWAFRRKNRRRNDLSLGWGSNSQWGTCFRRDYRIGENFYFNVDGSNDLSRAQREADRDGLAPHERLELLLHRCFITATVAHHDDCFPFHDTYRITIPAGKGGDKSPLEPFRSTPSGAFWRKIFLIFAMRR